jgi:heme exporter protein D
MQLGPHAAFIIGAYAATGLVVTALIGWVIADYRIQQRTLADLDARGVKRRAEPRGRETVLRDVT